MKTGPLSPNLLVFLLLPFVFLFVTSCALLLSSGYLLAHPSAPPKLLDRTTNYALFSTQPPTPVMMGESYVSKEARPHLMRQFLESYRSPLAPYTDYILEVSEKHGLDWRLLVGIAGNESLFGRVVPPDSYNAWGWGVHSRGTVRFRSWEAGIERVAKSLKEDFIDQGLTTIELIMTKYAPVSVANGYPWADNVKWFMERLEEGKGYRE